MPLTLPRRVTFVAKAEYFTTPGHQGLVPEDSSSPAPARCRSTGPAPRAAEGALIVGEAGPRRGRPVRHLPRGHPLARRQALPRQDRRRPARAGDRGAGDPGRRGRHRRGGASGQEVRHVHPARWSGSASRWTSPATRAWRTTATSCARSPTRSCTRSCGSPARSTSTSTPPAPRRSRSRADERDADGQQRRVRRRAEEGVLTRCASVAASSRSAGRGPAVPCARRCCGSSCWSTRSALNVWRCDNFDHPAAGWPASVVMVGWTVFAVWAYADPDRRTIVAAGAPTSRSRSALMLAVAPGQGRRASAPRSPASG